MKHRDGTNIEGTMGVIPLPEDYRSIERPDEILILTGEGDPAGLGWPKRPGTTVFEGQFYTNNFCNQTHYHWFADTGAKLPTFEGITRFVRTEPTIVIDRSVFEDIESITREVLGRYIASRCSNEEILPSEISGFLIELKPGGFNNPCLLINLEHNDRLKMLNIHLRVSDVYRHEINSAFQEGRLTFIPPDNKSWTTAKQEQWTCFFSIIAVIIGVYWICCY